VNDTRKESKMHCLIFTGVGVPPKNRRSDSCSSMRLARSDCLPDWLTKHRPAAALWKVSHGKFEMT